MLLFFLVEGSKQFKLLFHSMKLASFITLTPSFRQFSFMTRVYDDATQGSKSVTKFGTGKISVTPQLTCSYRRHTPASWASAVSRDPRIKQNMSSPEVNTRSIISTYGLLPNLHFQMNSTDCLFADSFYGIVRPQLQLLGIKIHIVNVLVCACILSRILGDTTWY